MAGLVFTKTSEIKASGKRHVYGTLAFDASYPTGGEAYTFNLFGFNNKPDQIIVFPSGGFLFDTDETNKKIIARGIALAGGAAAAGTDALSVKSGVLNKEQATVANIGLPEVTSTGDLSGLTAVPCIVIGTV